MRSFATGFLLIAAFLSGCWKEPSRFDWKNAPGAEQYERLMWQTIREKEWNEVQHHLASAFLGVAATGQKFDAAGWVTYWQGAQVSDFSIGELTVAPGGPDMVVSYRVTLKGTAVPSGDLRVVSVWQQVKKGWVLISQSQTPLTNSN
jgi:Domain of unknown function (DUF4440)